MYSEHQQLCNFFDQSVHTTLVLDAILLASNLVANDSSMIRKYVVDVVVLSENVAVTMHSTVE